MLIGPVKADDQQDKIGRLIVEFLNYPQIHPLLPVEFRDMVMDRPSGIRSKQDKDGFQRICAGVLWANKSEWAKLFEDPAWCAGMDAVEHTRDSVDVAATRGVIDRLTLRSALIHRRRTITSAQTFVERVLSRIDIILWSVDYAKVDRFSCGQLFRKMSKYQYPQYFSGVSEKTAWEAVAPQYRQWSKSLHNEITGYNRMYEMFIMYGPIILMDPVWQESAMRSHSRSAVHDALMRLSYSLDGPSYKGEKYHFLSPKIPAIEQALLSMVELIAGPFIAEHIFNFLDEMQPHIKIRCWPGFDKQRPNSG
ncbi:uncharacterized protein LAESUDRAFT_765532 [Laetiporus sulphureus 93-53]|uniref:Uncharacterized protein n=1 Tax=Laetiporus sulphureus 93-53 TaxID=1314785 RepID=A0A165AQ71_9APHY|nr:uncharacterized protein LAESUDRAFT_765532 [Laetiporus sulphureus 93-53]KZS99439.1 hypothetical protein LAESUDRAFT_765532 [Laetiporus sulphureus 93-53]